jgi:hypothetical protein
MPSPKHLRGATEAYRNADLSGPVELRSRPTRLRDWPHANNPGTLGLVATHGRRFATSATDKQAHDQVGRNSAGNCEK